MTTTQTLANRFNYDPSFEAPHTVTILDHCWSESAGYVEIEYYTFEDGSVFSDDLAARDFASLAKMDKWLHSYEGIGYFADDEE